jgi:large subunit ribosomal protein L34e
MVSGRHKSNTMRKVFVRLPGGKTAVRYKLRKPSRATCPMTGEKLQGVPNLRPVGISRLPKTKRRPQRAFGGVLSSRAARRVIVSKARSEPAQSDE